MKKILYIASELPYNTVPHAGGKTFNYYIKRIAQTEQYDVSMIAFIDQTITVKNDNEAYGIKSELLLEHNPSFKSCFFSTLANYSPFDKFGNMLMLQDAKQLKIFLKQKKSNGYYPDVIFLEWTNMVLLIDIIKQIYPKSKMIASEYDVCFLGQERKYKCELSMLKKLYRYARYRNLYFRELNALKKVDYVYVQSQKDKELLVLAGICDDKIGVLVPYYDRYIINSFKANANSIIFFGAMNREENYQSVIWFIDYVIPLISDFDFKFVIIGNHPPDCLKRMANEKIIITGYVDDVKPYFAEAIVGVVPLKLGAGIKVKVLEFAAAGVPVITNKIGIEGISLEQGKEYIHCETAQEYAEQIRTIFRNEINVQRIANAAKKKIYEDYNLELSFEFYKRKLDELC